MSKKANSELADKLSEEEGRWKDLMLGFVKPETEKERKMIKDIKDNNGIPHIPDDWP